MDKRIDKIQGFLFPKEKEQLMISASSIKPNSVVVEIGSYLGLSTAIIASNLPNYVEFYAIDTWNNDAMTEGLRDTFSIFTKNIEPWKDKITPIRGLSEEIFSTWVKPIDMLFIDADHSYEGVMKDLTHWYPFLKRNGLLLMHDYTTKTGVKEAVDEFFINKSEFEKKKLYTSLLVLNKG